MFVYEEHFLCCFFSICLLFVSLSCVSVMMHFVRYILHIFNRKHMYAMIAFSYDCSALKTGNICTHQS